MTMIWIGLLVFFLFGAFEVGYSFILIEKLKVASQHFGFTQGAFAVGMLLMSIYYSVGKEVQSPFLVSKRGIMVMGMIMGGMSLRLLITMPSTVIVAFYLVLMFSFGA